MRRFVILLLLWVLPIQFGLAATVDAFEHAQGEHVHGDAQHSHDVVVDAPNADAQDEASPGHGECGACHFAHSLALTALNAVATKPADGAALAALRNTESALSLSSVRPERPKWMSPV
jgi:hypothetical protein